MLLSYFHKAILNDHKGTIIDSKLILSIMTMLSIVSFANLNLYVENLFFLFS